MKVGVPKEIKTQEFRVGMVPSLVQELIKHGAKIWVEHDAGAGIGYTDNDYKRAGAQVVDVDAVFSEADLIVKVKEPQLSECVRFRPNQTLFTFLHLAAVPEIAEALCHSKVTAIAYETVTAKNGTLPILTPMSQVAGRMAIQAGAHCLEKVQGGRGLLLGGVPGVLPANVVVLGGGVVGFNAIRMAVGLEASVLVLDNSLSKLDALDREFAGRLQTVYASTLSIEKHLATADLVIGAVLVPGASAPKLITREMLRSMRNGSVFVDVSIDQGGTSVTSHPTTHNDPTYVDEGVVHYCVSNMPGAVPYTSTYALNHATMPFLIQLVTRGVKAALLNDENFLNGLNVCQGHITHEILAHDLQAAYLPPKEALHHMATA